MSRPSIKNLIEETKRGCQLHLKDLHDIAVVTYSLPYKQAQKVDMAALSPSLD
jgi:hypothetical protein